ncbi:MAG: YfiR family protein [Rickettsiales bacterium]
MLRNFLLYIIFLTCFCISSLTASYSQAAVNNEYAIKAAMITNMVRFVSWSDAYDKEGNNTIDVCVFGDNKLNDYGSVFEKSSFVRKQSAGGDKNFLLNLVEENNIFNIASHCRILFISKTEHKRTSDIISLLKDKPILTIGESSRFTDIGGMIEFTLNKDGNIKFVINKKASDKVGLYIDSLLLELAAKVIR